MTTDDSAPGSPRPGSPGAHTGDAGGPAGRGPLALMVLAVALAITGLLCLAAVLVSAALGWSVWPGFVVAGYLCLPLAFLLMVVIVIRAALARRRY